MDRTDWFPRVAWCLALAVALALAGFVLAAARRPPTARTLFLDAKLPLAELVQRAQEGDREAQVGVGLLRDMLR